MIKCIKYFYILLTIVGAPLFSMEYLETGTELKTMMYEFINQEEADRTFLYKFIYHTKTLNVGQDEAVVIEDFMGLIGSAPSALKHALHGAHVRIMDNGYLYFKWKELSEARSRISSHASLSGSFQYGIMGPICHEILFGIIEVEGELYTFFQFENTPWNHSITNVVWHSMDTIQYLITGKNIGPYGISIYTDRNPIILK